jgi:acetyl-CoA carboxylase biotin carboxylase subunit
MRAGVPVVPGTTTPLAPTTPDADVADAANEIGFPLMLKAVAGGGGKGMRLVASAEELPGALRAARSEALSAFGDGAVYLERRLARPRHIEVQLLCDEHGTVLPFVERECSVQRRHQKVLEESPSPVVGAPQRQALASAAARVASQVGYTNAGTIEFLLDEDGQFYFLEMNTRLQVEHPITELVTGVDLVHWQIRIAQGEPLTLDPDDVLTPRGHALEARVYAEDPDNRFLPSPGPVSHLRLPSGPGVRNDSGLASPGEVPIYYDPLVSKLSAWGSDRPQAIARLARALREYEIEGIRTTLPFFRWLLRQEAFLAARVSTAFLDEELTARAGAPFWDGSNGAADLAVIALAVELHAHPPRQVRRANGESAWQHTARREALR